MKEVTTKYYCDRCGIEVMPYGMQNEITSGYGLVMTASGYMEPRQHLFCNVDEYKADATERRCAMGLCKECFDGLTAYLRNE